MEQRRTTLDGWMRVILLFSLSSATAFAGTTLFHELKSDAVAVNAFGISSVRRIAIYLPDGYQSGAGRYPVIYWLPGWQQPATNEYERGLTRAIQIGRLPAVIVVSVHVPEGILFMNSQLFGHWESFLIDEVIRFVDKTYRTIPKATHRALMGHSVGGYAAMMLPLLRPGIWNSVGMNDGSVWLGCDFRSARYMPPSLESYETTDSIGQVMVQLGVALTPNPAKAIGFDEPWAADASSGVIARWDTFCLKRPKTISLYRDKLSALSSIAVVVPELSTQTNRDHELRMVDVMRAEGVPVTVLQKPGGHDGDRADRFISLAAETVRAMELDVPRAFTWVGKLSVAWGALRQE